MSKRAKYYYPELPHCDVHTYEKKLPRYEAPKAVYDVRLPVGVWGYVCQECFDEKGCELGTGKGQKLELIVPEPLPAAPRVSSLVEDPTKISSLVAVILAWEKLSPEKRQQIIDLLKIAE